MTHEWSHEKNPNIVIRSVLLPEGGQACENSKEGESHLLSLYVAQKPSALIMFNNRPKAGAGLGFLDVKRWFIYILFRGDPFPLLRTIRST